MSTSILLAICDGQFWLALWPEGVVMPRPKEFTVALTVADRAKLTKVVPLGYASGPDDRPGPDPARPGRDTGSDSGPPGGRRTARGLEEHGVPGGQGVHHPWRRVEDLITRKKRATPPIEPTVTGDAEARVMSRDIEFCPVADRKAAR